MIPSDHFVRFYNEVFKALEARGHEHLVAYWRELGTLQAAELADRFREGGLQACYDYWQRIRDEENCDMELALTENYLEGRMNACPSLSKILDNDAAPCELYCDHCMGWVEPVMEASGLHAVMDMQSRTEPRCLFRVYEDKKKASQFAEKATLLARPCDQEPPPA